MKKEKEHAENVSEKEKSFWIIGIAIIVFLVLLFGSIVGLRITENGMNDVVDNANGIIQNGENGMAYKVLEDGTKQNVSKKIANAEFSFEGIEVTNCAILERENESEIAIDVSNLTESPSGQQRFLIKLYNAENKLISEFSVITGSVEPMSTATIRTILQDKCAEAVAIDVSLVNA